MLKNLDQLWSEEAKSLPMSSKSYVGFLIELRIENTLGAKTFWSEKWYRLKKPQNGLVFHVFP